MRLSQSLFSPSPAEILLSIAAQREQLPTSRRRSHILATAADAKNRGHSGGSGSSSAQLSQELWPYEGRVKQSSGCWGDGSFIPDFNAFQPSASLNDSSATLMTLLLLDPNVTKGRQRRCLWRRRGRLSSHDFAPHLPRSMIFTVQTRSISRRKSPVISNSARAAARI